MYIAVLSFMLPYFHFALKGSLRLTFRWHIESFLKELILDDSTL